MEALGIYEVIEEDLALCEFVDVSKHNVQEIVREGIDLLVNA
jgi:Na+-transporting NADH:ubiquinone oxidoreductase subunit A